MGDVLDSLKGARSGRSIRTSEGNQVEVDDFEFYLKSINEWSNYYGTVTGDIKEPTGKEKKKLKDEWNQKQQEIGASNLKAARAEMQRRYPNSTLTFNDSGKIPVSLVDGKAVSPSQLTVFLDILKQYDAGQYFTAEKYNYSKYQSDLLIERGDLLVGLQELASGLRKDGRTKLFEWTEELDDEITQLEVDLRGAQIKEANAKSELINKKTEEFAEKIQRLPTGGGEGGAGRFNSGMAAAYYENHKKKEEKKRLEQEINDITIDFGSTRYKEIVNKKLSSLESELQSVEEIIDPFIIRQGEIMIEDTITYFTYKGKDFSDQYDVATSKHNYIRWDFVCFLLNRFILPETQKDEPITGFTCFEETNNHYLEYAASFGKEEEIKIPRFTDSLNENEYLATEYQQSKFNLNDILDCSYNPDVALLPHQLLYGSKFEKSSLFKGRKALGAFTNSFPRVSSRSIGLIYIKIDYLINAYKELRYDNNGGLRGDFSLLKFIKKVWEQDITSACANTHNFKVTTENNRRGYTRIIDLGFQTDLKKESLYELQVQSQMSDVRDFSFNTVIDSKLSSTIAIAAQAPDSIDDLEQLTIKAFNKNISNRFSNVKKTKENYASERTKAEQNLILSANKLKFYLDEMLMGEFATQFGGDKWTEGNKINVIQVSTAINIARRLNDLKHNLSVKHNLKDSKAGQLKDEINLQKSAIIPLTFNAQIDGIGGIIIGNVFRIDPDRLPLGYQKDDIGFVVTTESQKITSGQDWITNFTGQLILLDVFKGSRKGNVITKGGNSGCYVGLEELRKEFAQWLINASEFPDNGAFQDKIRELVPTSDWVTHPKLSFNSRVTTGYKEWVSSDGKKSSKPEGKNDVSACLDEHPDLCGDITQLSDNLMQDIATAAANVPEIKEVEITYSRYKYPHDERRHWIWAAVDISKMDCGNGLKGWSNLEDAKANGCITKGTLKSGTDSEGTYSKLEGPMADFVNNLASMAKPYTINAESGHPQAVLWFGFKGHHHHLHVSNTD